MRFAELYKESTPTLSFEFFPPAPEAGLDGVKQLISTLAAEKPHFMTVTYGAGGGTRTRTCELVSYIKHELKFAAATAHLTCGGHSVAEIDAVLDQLEQSGIGNIVALRGDPEKGQTEFVPHPEGFSDARMLVEHINRRGGFSLAVAGYPEGHKEAVSMEEDLRHLKRKVDAGAEVVLTQLFFDEELYFRFRDRAEAIGITVPLVPGLLPIGNVKQVRRFTSMCGASIPNRISARLEMLESDPDGVIEFGIEEAVRLSSALLRGGAPGLHIYTLNKSHQTAPVVQALRTAGIL